MKELMERLQKEVRPGGREKAAKWRRVCVCVCVWPDGSSVWRPARGTGAGHMTSRYHGDGDCSWREDERRRAPGTERGRETLRWKEGEPLSKSDGDATVEHRPRGEQGQQHRAPNLELDVYCQHQSNFSKYSAL